MAHHYEGGLTCKNCGCSVREIHTYEGLKKRVEECATPTKCMVTKDADHAVRMKRLLGPEWYTISCYGAICGRHFDLIVVMPDWKEDKEEAADKWFDEVMRCRLRDRKTGEIVFL